jgi:hypothetical protein
MIVGVKRGFSVGVRLLAGVVIAGMIETEPVRADNDGTAFLGGIMAGHALSRFGEMQRRRNEELAMMARGGYGHGYGGGYGGGYGSEQPAPQYQAPSMTPEQKLNQLDKLAAGGYITPAEYKERRQAILNTL